MIKIIKHGTRDIRECDSCGCLFSFDKEDIEYKDISNKEEGELWISERVTCPQCGEPIFLKEVGND